LDVTGPLYPIPTSDPLHAVAINFATGLATAEDRPDPALSVTDKMTKAFRYVVIFTELYPGDLSDLTASPYYTHLSPEQKQIGHCDIVKQITEGLKICHGCNLIHRDLKIDYSKPDKQRL
jgi:serine/threonine protein kinase